MVTIRNFFLFFLFFPYVVVGNDMSSDVQPIAGILGVILILYASLKNKLTHSVYEVFFVIFIVLATILYGFNQSVESFSFVKFVNVYYAFIVYIAAKYTFKKDNYTKYIKIFAWIYLAGVFLQIILPDVYANVFSYIVREVKVQDVYGIRGVSAFTTEPSFTGMILLFFMLLITRLERFRDIDNNKLLFLLALGVLLTKAMTAYIFLIVFALHYAYNKGKSLGFLALLLAISLVLILIKGSDIRPVQVFIALVNGDISIWDISSLYYRIYYILTGIVSIYLSPLGAILQPVDPEIIQTGVFDIIPAKFLDVVDFGINMPSTLGLYLHLYGIFYLVFILYTWIYIYIKSGFIVLTYIIMLTIASFPFGFPFVWLVVALCSLGEFKKSKI
jgi:hypothetical protein